MAGRRHGRDSEAERIIARVGAETEARMAVHEDDGDDIELWGKRIGRILALVLLVVLLWWLYRALFMVGA